MIIEGVPLQVPATGTDFHNLLEEWRSTSAQRYNLTYSLANAMEVCFVESSRIVISCNYLCLQNFHMTGAYAMMMMAAHVS